MIALVLKILSAAGSVFRHLGDVIVLGYRVRKMVTNDLPHLEAEVRATRREVRDHIAFCRGVRASGRACPTEEPSR